MVMLLPGLRKGWCIYSMILQVRCAVPVGTLFRFLLWFFIALWLSSENKDVQSNHAECNVRDDKERGREDYKERGREE